MATTPTHTTLGGAGGEVEGAKPRKSRLLLFGTGGLAVSGAVLAMVVAKSGNSDRPDDAAVVASTDAVVTPGDASSFAITDAAARDKRKAYVTVGHGEVNDPGSIPPDMKPKVGERRTTLFKQRLGDLNYEVKDLGAITLASSVPDDATVVLVMAPIAGLQDAEWQSIDRYLQKGGRVLIALDPKASPGMGALEGRLGLKMNPTPITDDEKFLPQGRGSIADRRFAMTTQFAAHSSTTALSRSEKGGLPLIDAGSLDDIPFVDAVQPKKTVTIRSMESSWLDINNNFKYDADGGEKKQRYTVGIAIEGPKLERGKDGFRALVYSDVDMFVDVAMRSGQQQVTLMLSGPLLDDSVKWLGGE